MLVAEAPPAVVDAGTIAASLTAVLVLVGIATRARPVRWVWRRVVADPVGGFLRGIVADEVAPTADALVAHMAEEIVQRQADAAEASAWRAEIRADVKGLQENVTGLHERLDRTLEAVLTGIHPGDLVWRQTERPDPDDDGPST